MFHWLKHKWGKWTVAKYKDLNGGVLHYNRRECLVCGFVQEELI